MMKVKEYLVSEILDLKHNIRKLQEDIDRKDKLITAQHGTIERFEKREREFKENNNRIYGKLCEVRQIIHDGYIPGDSGCSKTDLSINVSDFDKLLKLLDIKPEDHKNQNIPECDFCTYSTPEGTCSRNDCEVGNKFEPVHVCDTCKYIKCPGDEEPCLNCTGDNSKWERRGEDVKTED